MEKFESNIFEKVDGYKQRKSNIGNCALSSFSLLFSTPPDRLFLLESNMNIPTQINYEKSNPKFPPPFPKSSNICSTLFTISEFHSPKKLHFFFNRRIIFSMSIPFDHHQRISDPKVFAFYYQQRIFFLLSKNCIPYFYDSHLSFSRLGIFKRFLAFSTLYIRIVNFKV